MENLASLLGIIGNITTIMLLLSPMPTFWVIFRRRTAGCFSAQPYLFSLLSSMLWAYYAGLQLSLSKGGFLLLTISLAACAFYCFYLFLYLFFGSRSQREKSGWFLLAIFCFCTIVIISTKKALHGKEALTAVGLLCTVVSAFSNAAPLSIMRRVIKTRSVQYMPFSLSLCLFVNGVVWLAYAVCLKDMYLTVTNGLAVTLGLVQLGLYGFYRVYGVKMHQVANDIGDLTMKVGSVENVEMDVKICSGRLSRAGSCFPGPMDFNISVIDFPSTQIDICALSNQTSGLSKQSSGLAKQVEISGLSKEISGLSKESSGLAKQSSGLNKQVQEISGLIKQSSGLKKQSSGLLNKQTSGTLRKLPTPRSIFIDAHLALEELPRISVY